MAMPDGGLFAIFSHPDESEQIARELLAQTEKWREAIDGPNGPDTGRHAHIVVDGTETAELPVYTDDEPVYPDPAALQAQAAEMEAAGSGS
ncbi:hypothetical protein IU501_34475 [Nocardia otitidiscaviarum]|uniref:hypothetical protein n=1 Tax=Nocardia otitidiscaviarum TaxID=1823 RepID=UPI001893038B|nr:hypothetical protein [Nocardia otitidiscaviarum]MBF6138076.1 hypothetical protein [Nocardia otitidiscaviarum]